MVAALVAGTHNAAVNTATSFGQHGVLPPPPRGTLAASITLAQLHWCRRLFQRSLARLSCSCHAQWRRAWRAACVTRLPSQPAWRVWPSSGRPCSWRAGARSARRRTPRRAREARLVLHWSEKETKEKHLGSQKSSAAETHQLCVLRLVQRAPSAVRLVDLLVHRSRWLFVLRAGGPFGRMAAHALRLLVTWVCMCVHECHST